MTEATSTYDELDTSSYDTQCRAMSAAYDMWDLSL
jgi:hypothetical protein